MQQRLPIGEAVMRLLIAARDKDSSESTPRSIAAMLPWHSERPVPGRVFGYSVSDYAFAALYWIGTPRSLQLYHAEIAQISEKRRAEVEELISRNTYLQL